MDGRAQTGVVGCVHVDDYEHDVIRKHEKTRQDKEDDRTRHVLTLNANAEPVFLTYRGRAEIDGLVEQDRRHHDAALRLHRPRRRAAHRLAGARPRAARAAPSPRCRTPTWPTGTTAPPAPGAPGRSCGPTNPAHRGDEEYNWFLAVLFPADQLRILPYNRVVRDLDGLTRGGGARRGCADSGGSRRPRTRSRTGAACSASISTGAWHRLELDPAAIDRADPIASLDVSLLQDRVLAPDPRHRRPAHRQADRFRGRDPGHGGAGAAGPNSGEMAIAFSLYPTTLDQLMAVSDAGQVMPPKSTWFEPKLRSGLFVHELS